MIDFPERTNYSIYYDRTIHRILAEGYRFPDWVPESIYEAYGDYIVRLKKRTDEHCAYIAFLKEISPEWKPKKTQKEIAEASFEDKRTKAVYRYNLKGDLISTYKNAYEAFMDTGYPIDSIVEACRSDNYKAYRNSYWYFRMMHPKVREKILQKKGTFPSKKDSLKNGSL